MYYVNEHIKNCVRIFPEEGRYACLRLDMNENPEGLPEDFVEEVKKEKKHRSHKHLESDDDV